MSFLYFLLYLCRTLKNIVTKKSLVKTIACCAVSIFVTLFSLGYLNAATTSHDCPEGMHWDEESQTCLPNYVCDQFPYPDKNEAVCYENTQDKSEKYYPCKWTGRIDSVCRY